MVEIRIGDYGLERGRFLVQLRMCYLCRLRETGARGKLAFREGNNPDYG